MKKNKILLGLSFVAACGALSAPAMASSTEASFSYGGVVTGDTESVDGFTSGDAKVFDLLYKTDENIFLEGRYALSETDEDDVEEGYTGEFSQYEAGLGLELYTGNEIFDTFRVGTGYFKQVYAYDSTTSEDGSTTALSDIEAEGIYLKASVDLVTSISGLTVTGQYTHYVGNLTVDGSSSDYSYEYGLLTAKAAYQVSDALDLNAFADFADSEKAVRVGATYTF